MKSYDACMTTSYSDPKVALLKDEYLMLQKFYEDFDARIMTIKGWSATVGLAAIGGGFYQSRFLWLFAAGAGLVFWSLDAVWKSFQYNYAPRIRLLEAAFRSQEFENIAPLQVYTAWFESFQPSGFAFFRHFRMGIVMFPHIVPVVAGIALFVLESAGVVNVGRQSH